MALLGAALARRVASKFLGQWKDCDKCSRRPRSGLRHEIGGEIVESDEAPETGLRGQSHETKDKGNENRHRGESAGDANDGRRARERRLRAESRKADSALHLEAQGRVRAALRGLGKGLLQDRRARRAAR